MIKTPKFVVKLELPKGIECICPCCWQVHRKLLDSRYTGDPHLWRVYNRLAIMCEDCSGKMSITDPVARHTICTMKLAAEARLNIDVWLRINGIKINGGN